MGVDCSYVTTYTKGLLRRLAASARRGQCHFGGGELVRTDDGQATYYRSCKGWFEALTAFGVEDEDTVSVRKVRKGLGSSFVDQEFHLRMFCFEVGGACEFGGTCVRYIPDLGLLCVDPGLRFYNHDAEHTAACTYLASLGAPDTTVSPDWMSPHDYANKKGYAAKGAAALAEIPPDLLTEVERQRCTAVFGPAEDDDASVEAALHQGRADAVLRHAQTLDEVTYAELLTLACEARSTTVLAALLDAPDRAAHARDLLRGGWGSARLHEAVRRDDLPTAAALVERGTPVTASHENREMFAMLFERCTRCL